LRQENWLVIDRFQPYEDQLDTYRHGLANAPRGKDYLDSLSPEAKEALGQLQAPRPQGEAQEPARGLGQS
jgi:hypothetical protein